MAVPVLFADLHNADEQGRVRLNGLGTVRDLARLGVRLTDGLHIVLSDHDELEADAEVVFSAEERAWVAKIDWDAIRRVPTPLTAPRG